MYSKVRAALLFGDFDVQPGLRTTTLQGFVKANDMSVK